MNKLLLVTVACVLLISTVGATATVTATQIGHSSIYYFDVKDNAGKAVGLVVVNAAHAKKTPTYALVAHGLTPNTQYRLGYTVSGVVHTLGSATTTTTGALVMYGTFAADVKDSQSAQFWVMELLPAPAPGSGYTQISMIRIFQDGLFVAKLSLYYSTDGGVTWKETMQSNGMGVRDQGEWEIGAFGVPAGALVKIHVTVVGGVGGAKAKTGSEVFQYVPFDLRVIDHGATYTFSGSTLKNTLLYDGLYRC